MKHQKSKLCSICGKNPATTRDHIPPKGIFPKPRPSDLVTVPACLTCNKSTSDLLDSRTHNYIIEKTIRGLHFHHTGNILADQADISVNWHYSLTENMYKMSLNWFTGVVGKGQFIYKFFTHPKEPLASVWIFQFFNKAWSSGTVLPKGR